MKMMSNFRDTKSKTGGTRVRLTVRMEAGKHLVVIGLACENGQEAIGIRLRP